VSLTSSVPDPETGVAFTATGKSCSFCTRSLTDPAIHWMFADDAEIYLHEPCVWELFKRLGRDCHEATNPDYYRRRGRSS
jgi:hypothetical protein